MPTFFGRLCATTAEQTGATRVAFWRIGSMGGLTVQPLTHGFADDSPIHELRLRAGSEIDGIVSDDVLPVDGTLPELDRFWRDNRLDVTNSIAASWCAGERRIGVLAAYDAVDGFSATDLWVLKLTAMAAGLLWQYKEAEDELGQTAVRLEEAMAARRHLINNIAAGGDEARRRFASALHDDSLQLLTAAELQLERIHSFPLDAQNTAQVAELKSTLRKVEDSLRRLLINVSPEPLQQLSSTLSDAISERLEQMRLRSGIESRIETRLPDEVPAAIQALVMKNISEALNNVEKHARATRVTVVAEEIDGGIHVEVIDDGTGFVVAESFRVPGHIGLVALRERSQLAGGSCRIASDPGAGTNIEFWVPMNL
ncbi:MAG TPA: ATP-binding protein [Candidatus Dormibacteraeota bacterium]|nr:ATP-binding protein [Candidatus Dormibacteraeota bacterium]